MPTSRRAVLVRILHVLAGAIVLKVTADVVSNYRSYVPPRFDSDFLRGRDAYFFGDYQWAFYPHIAVGPVTLVLGTILISDRFRRRFPFWHRLLGRVQALAVLLVVAPSGLWMAARAAAGPLAAAGFALLAMLTGLTMALGWRTAVRRQFAAHRRWMWRCYLLLCSTVILRLVGGLAAVTGFDSNWLEPLTAWASWLVPLAILEAWNGGYRRSQNAAPRRSGIRQTVNGHG